MRPLILVGVALTATLFPLAAMAQSDPDYAGGSADPEFEGNTGAIVINGLSIAKRQDLDFGVIAPSLTLAGTVKVHRGQNFQSICSSELTCLEPGNRARFKVIGEPNRYYTIADPGQVWIQNGSNNNMLVDTFFGAGSGNETEWRGWQKLRSSGIARFNLGAILHVNPNQQPGTYTGTFTLTVEYQ
ncbi:MAG: DUF4402 domain-containing protein [Pseudomonadota bacterium]